MLIYLVLLTTVFVSLFWPQANVACGKQAPCEIDGRSYNALPPPGWDGASPLPVLLHFHGWGRQGKNVIRNARITDATAQNGMLLLAPNGLYKSWDFSNSDSRDAGFIEQVLVDAAKHWRIDRARVYVSGFSYGGAMAWRIACIRGDEFAGYLPIAGGLWRQSDVSCKSPVRLAHVHGLDDNVYGLPIGPLDDVEEGVLLWRRMNGASDKPQQRFNHARYDCRQWGGAESLTLCTHKGGHFIPKYWLSWALPRMMSGG
jgi:polyhydroxybutyrate depolymerase